jgi:Ca-activated chloride channel family protein
MEFLNPNALFGLLALPLLLLPYLIRRKPRRVMFSSLLLLMESGETASSRAWGRIHLPWIFFLQLLLLALLIVALSEPVFSIHPTNVAIILDNSATMQAVEAGKTRLNLAKAKARSLIDAAGVAGKIDLYVTTPRITKLSAAPLSAAQAASAIDALEAYDLGDPPLDYNHILDQLAREYKYQRVYLITDHPARGQTATARTISVGQPQANFAVTGFDVHRSSLANVISGRLEASVEVANFSNKDEKVKIVIKGGERALANRELSVPAGKTATASFDNIADQPFYQAEIENRDAFMLDNRRFAVLPAGRSLRILAISPRPKEIASLKAIPGVDLDIIVPSAYGETDTSAYGLEIFHFATPAALPRNPTLFILPPQNNSLVDLAAPVANITVSNWREPHTLTRYVNFSLFRPAYARPLKPQSAGESIIESADGPLAFAVEHRGLRYLTLGFDPLPYLGRENLPMSIFTLNFLDWFFDASIKSQATGEPLALGRIEPGDLIVSPKGETISLTAGYDYFAATFYQGIYERRRGGVKELSARNFQDQNESDLRAPTPIDLSGGTVQDGSTSVLFSFWPYLLTASILLLVLEWFASPRMTKLALRRRAVTLSMRS